MKSTVLASVAFALLTAVAAHGQHSLGMHTHSGSGSDSACRPGRFDGPIKLYPPDQRGDLDHKLSTNNLQAQRFFNQGLTFFYGFDSESAMRSFHQAAVEDPGLAMAYWGVALAAGGDLNIPIDDPCMKLAREQSELANGRLASASPSEKLYINALAQRYATLRPNPNPDGPLDPSQLGVYYELAMKSVYEKLGSTDPDSGALYANSLMNLRPWFWWTTSGQASVEITEALDVFKKSLVRFPNHIGLNHFNVHAWEEGPVADAGQARDSADFLFKKAPLITPHLLHMPAHTFLLLGDWEGVVQANLNAVKADEPWVKDCSGAISSSGCNQLLVGHYYSHDMLFLDVGYGNRGQWEEVDKRSTELENNVLRFIATQPGLEHYLTTKVAMRVHFGKWQQLVDLPPPPTIVKENFCDTLKYPLATAMWYYGRAVGNASLKRETAVDLEGFLKAQGCVQKAGIGWGTNFAWDILNVVHWRLLERVALMKGQMEATKEFARLAVETQDLLNYDEPPGWYLSSREDYGGALYLAGNFEQAIKVFSEDLERHPNSSRSLYGFWQALKALRALNNLQPDFVVAETERRFREQWKSTILPKMEDL